MSFDLDSKSRRYVARPSKPETNNVKHIKHTVVCKTVGSRSCILIKMFVGRSVNPWYLLLTPLPSHLYYQSALVYLVNYITWFCFPCIFFILSSELISVFSICIVLYPFVLYDTRYSLSLYCT